MACEINELRSCNFYSFYMDNKQLEFSYSFTCHYDYHLHILQDANLSHRMFNIVINRHDI